MPNNKIERDVGLAFIRQLVEALAIVILGAGLFYAGINPTGIYALIPGIILMLIGVAFGAFIYGKSQNVETRSAGGQ